MKGNFQLASLLAAADWQSVVAAIIFLLVSAAAGWVKKRSEAAANSKSPGQEEDEEFDAVEIFDEPRSMQMPKPAAKRTPPILVVQRGRRALSAAPPKQARPLETEKRTRVEGTHAPMPKVSPSATVATPVRPTSTPRKPPSESRDEGAADRPLAIESLMPDLFDANALRRAIIAAELLNPPLALRDPASSFGHTI